MCPLLASIQAVESGRNYQKCLTYWVLFSIATILESALEKLLLWVPFWPYAKGILIILLVLPYFKGASYIYNHFIRAYLFINPQLLEPLLILEANENQENNFIGNPDKEKVRHTIVEGEASPSYATIEHKIQKEWSCAICLVTTTSKKCLKKHLLGRLHKANIEELKDEKAFKTTTNNTNNTSFFNRSNRITWVNLESLSGILSPVSRSIRWCTWNKPSYGWTKLNTDGSVDNESSGFGGLFRDYKGAPICGYVSKAPPYDIFLIELWAIWRGLVLASNLGIKVLWVESDSLSVVKTINKKQGYSPRARGCLKDVWDILEKFEKYRITHAWRETNRAADHLAKMEISGSSDAVLWPNSFSKSLCKIIQEDAQGKWYRRV